VGYRNRIEKSTNIKILDQSINQSRLSLTSVTGVDLRYLIFGNASGMVEFFNLHLAYIKSYHLWCQNSAPVNHLSTTKSYIFLFSFLSISFNTIDDDGIKCGM